ncbi:MAG: hypothetical protein AAGC97_10320 [Planctomycetota bacterium]
MANRMIESNTASLVLAFAMTIGWFVAGDAIADENHASTVWGPRDDGAIAIEAEQFAHQSADDVRQWHILQFGQGLPDLPGAGKAESYVMSDSSAAKQASQSAFIRILPDTRRTHDDKLIRGENFSPDPGKMAIVDYQVDFPRPGRYFVWARAFSTGSEDNGLHVGLNGAWPASGQRMQWCKGKNQWTWNCAQRTNEQHCGVPMQVFLDVAEPGIHTISISMREDGFSLDQLLLVDDETYRPESSMTTATIAAN